MKTVEEVDDLLTPACASAHDVREIIIFPIPYPTLKKSSQIDLSALDQTALQECSLSEVDQTALQECSQRVDNHITLFGDEPSTLSPKVIDKVHEEEEADNASGHLNAKKYKKHKVREDSVMASALKTTKKKSTTVEESAPKKARKEPKDPNAPRAPANPYLMYASSIRKGNALRRCVYLRLYLIFTKEIHDELPELSMTDISRETGLRWKSLSDEAKGVFVEEAKKDRKRYMDEV